MPISIKRRLWLYRLFKLKTKVDRRKVVKSRRDKWLEENGPCVICGSDDRLEIDHIDPKLKSFPINFGLSMIYLKSELNKCQVLCKVCHARKSGLERRGIKHKKRSKKGLI